MTTIDRRLDPAPPAGVVAMPDGRGVVLASGGLTATLHPQWLRDRTIEPGQVDATNRQRLFTPRDLPADLAVVDCHLEGDHLVVSFTDGHSARLAVESIARLLGWEPDPEQPPASEPWFEPPATVPTADWAGIGWSDRGGDAAALIDLLDDFYRHGYVVLRGTPVEEGTVARVGERMGYVFGQNFGRVFDVRVEPQPTDLAYTAVELLAHTDLPYRREPPGIQLLHCLVNEASGGESTMADGLAAALTLAAEAPSLHRALVEIEVDYRYDMGTDTVVNTGHVLEYDRHGRFRGIRLNTKLDTPIPRPGVDLDAWYEGRRWLTDWLNDPEHRALFSLEPGDVLFMDNHRVLHGRAAFDQAAGRRHLQGCYIEHDGPDTLYRLARRRTSSDPDRIGA